MSRALRICGQVMALMLVPMAIVLVMAGTEAFHGVIAPMLDGLGGLGHFLTIFLSLGALILGLYGIWWFVKTRGAGIFNLEG